MANKLILLVEDNPDDEALALRALKKNDIQGEVVVVRDGVEALDYLFCTGTFSDRDINVMPDLVLLDLILPCMNGVEFLKIVRGRPEFNHIPVVICSSVVETKEIREVMSGWIHGYLVKPINKEKLLEKLLAALHGIAVRVDYQY